MATSNVVKHALDLELELIYASQGVIWSGNEAISHGGHATFEGTLGTDTVTIDLPYSTWVELGKPNKLTTLIRTD